MKKSKISLLKVDKKKSSCFSSASSRNHGIQMKHGISLLVDTEEENLVVIESEEGILRKGGSVKNTKRNISFSPVSLCYFYRCTKKGWYQSGKHSAFSDFETKYLSIDTTITSFLNDYQHNSALDSEETAIKYYENHVPLKQVNTSAQAFRHFDILVSDIYERLWSYKKCEEEVELLTTELVKVLETASYTDVAEDINTLESPEFLVAMSSYLKMCCLNDILGNRAIHHLISAKYCGLCPEPASREIAGILNMLKDSSDFATFPGELNLKGISTIGVHNLSNRFYICLDLDSDSNLASTEYEDAFTGAVLNRYNLPNHGTEIDIVWLLTNLRFFLIQPKKAWCCSKIIWAANYIKVLNCCLIMALINNQCIIRDLLVNIEITEDIALQMTKAQKIAHEYFQKKEAKLLPPHKHRDSAQSLLNEIEGEQLDEEIVEEEEDSFYNLGRHLHRKFKMSCRNFVIRQTSDLPLADGYEAIEKEPTPYDRFIDTHAYSLHVNPVIRADLEYSKRGKHVYKSSSGHCSKLLLTLIRMEEVDSVAFLLQHKIRVNVRVCAGITKSLCWEKTEHVRSMRKYLKDCYTHRKTASGEYKYKRRIRDKAFLGGHLFDESTLSREIKDISKFCTEEAIVLKSRFEKVTPLEMAIEQLGLTIMNGFRVENNHMILSLLIESNANFDKDVFRGYGCFLSIIRSIIHAREQKKHTERKKQARTLPEPPTRPTTRNRNFFKRLLAVLWYRGDVPSLDSRVIPSQFKSYKVIADSNTLQRRKKKHIEDRKFLDVEKLLDISKKHFFSLSKHHRGCDIQWKLFMKVSLLYQCIIQEEFDLFLRIAPCTNSELSDSVESKEVSLERTADECLDRLLTLLANKLMKPSCLLFGRILNGVIFILDQYRVLPTKNQLEKMFYAILNFQACSIQLRFEKEILKFLKQSVIIDVLSNNCSNFGTDHSRSNIRNVLENFVKLRFGRDQKWNIKCNKIRCLLLETSIRSNMYHVFDLLYLGQVNKDKLRFKEMSQQFLFSIVHYLDSSRMLFMIDFLTEHSQEDNAKMSLIEGIFEACMEQYVGFHLVETLLDSAYIPRLSLCEDFLGATILENPLINLAHSDRTSDFTIFNVFTKLLKSYFIFDKHQESEQVLNTKLASYEDLFTGLCNNFEDISGDDKLLVWCAGLHHLLERFYVFKESIRYFDSKYDNLRNMVQCLQTFQATEIRHNRWNLDSFSLQDDCTYLCEKVRTSNKTDTNFEELNFQDLESYMKKFRKRYEIEKGGIGSIAEDVKNESKNDNGVVVGAEEEEVSIWGSVEIVSEEEEIDNQLENQNREIFDEEEEEISSWSSTDSGSYKIGLSFTDLL